MQFVTPTDFDYQVRGLHEVQLDPDHTLLSFHDPARTIPPHQRFADADWISGCARLVPTPAYPLLQGRQLDALKGPIEEHTAEPNGGLVRFHFCAHGDSASSAAFRRQAQVKALATVDPPMTTGRTFPSPSSAGPPSGRSTPVLDNALLRRCRPPSQVVAWWEDDLGMWLLVEAYQMATFQALEEAWDRSIGICGRNLGPIPSIQTANPSSEPQQGPHKPQQERKELEQEPDLLQQEQQQERNDNPLVHANGSKSSSSRWADACDLLADVVTCLQALHDRHISLNWCHPKCFGILDGSLVVTRLWDATALPGFNLTSFLPPGLAASPLFNRESLDHGSVNLSETYVFRHLRYLAPEAAITRRVAPSNDIYGWGVLAYELLTGTTIDGAPDTPELANLDLLADIHRHVTTEVQSPTELLEQRMGDRGLLPNDLPPKQLSGIVVKALAKDPYDRYHSLDVLSYELRKLSRICRKNGDLSKFNVGEADRLSRFSLPKTVIERSAQLDALDGAFAAVAEGITSSRCINIWGKSGNGKTRVVEEWVQSLEVQDGGRRCLVGRSSQSGVKGPLASFVLIFQSLLDRVMTDPNEDAKVWVKNLRRALGSHWVFFTSILGYDTRRLLGEDPASSSPDIDWESSLKSFVLWARAALQPFATASRPLILIVDDAQDLPPGEVETWQQLIDGTDALNHVLVVSMTRSETPPSSTSFLSASTLSLKVDSLTEEGVTEYISVCLNGRASGGKTFTSFIYGETQGSPLFLGTLMTRLAKEEVVTFDYDSLEWHFDLVALQTHLSDASFDSYLDSVLQQQPIEVRELLMLLSHLPAAGFPIKLLGKAVGLSDADTEAHIQQAVTAGALSIRGPSVRFTHDRQRSAAQRLVPKDSATRVHQRLYKFLSAPDLVETYFFDAVDHAVTARKLGTDVDEPDVTVSLLLEAAVRASSTAGFTAAKRYIDEAESIIFNTGGIQDWVKHHRSVCFQYARLSTEISSIFTDHEAAVTQLEAIKPYCDTSAERISISTFMIRQLIASDRPEEAMKELLKTLDEFGYNPVNPTTILLWSPQSAGEVEQFGDSLTDFPTSANDLSSIELERLMIATMISHAGPTAYVTLPEQRQDLFILGLSVCKAQGKVHETLAYQLGILSILLTEPSIQYALMKLAKRVAGQRPNRLHTSSALVCVAGQSHRFMSLSAVAEEMEHAFDATLAVGDYEVACYVVGLDVAARLFCKSPMQWDLITQRYSLVKSYANALNRYFVNISLQYASKLGHMTKQTKPWELEGKFFHQRDIDNIVFYAMHRAVYDTCTLRLKLIFNAPIDEVRRSIEAGRQTIQGAEGLIFEAEMKWLLGVAAIRCGSNSDLLAEAHRYLGHYCTYSSDIQSRIAFLSALEEVTEDPLHSLPAVEATIEAFDDENQHQLSGLLNWFVADAIIKHTNSTRLAAGFIHASFQAYKRAEMFAACEMLSSLFAAHCPTVQLAPRGPPDALMIDVVVPGRRGSLSTIGDTVSSTSTLTYTGTGNASSAEVTSAPPENLDALTLMRSSLVVAQEKDSVVLLGSLLRILCQFTRCDYAAIALVGDEDKTELRLKAAGPFQRIVPYNLDIRDEVAQAVCPSAIMLHVFRTGLGITSPSKLSRLRNDQFCNQRRPRTIFCMPIINQGIQSGVITLLSTNAPSPALESESTREVVSTLTTFAYIIHSHQQFAGRLKDEVAMRTSELTTALQAKTQFLSQCSHELRSPLAAIMGLASVLEASAGLSPIQREHLQTILASGQDLLALISNILDHSKLESHSVLLERIPFNLQDVVESALDTIAPVAQSKNVELTSLNIFRNNPPGLVGDPFRVKQVLLNLLSNAVKFTRPEASGPAGRVTVQRTWEALDQERIKVTLTIADTGVGIPASKLHKLFRSFSQVDESITRSFGGSGLGLVISRDLARLLGGDCTVESEFGKGSTFSFTFVATRDPTYSEPRLRVFEHTQKIFILSEPEMAWSKLLADDLSVLNCQSTLFHGDASLALNPDNTNGLATGQYYDIVILDTTQLTRELLVKIRQAQPNARMLYVTKVTQISRDMDLLHVPREAVLSRPLKFTGVYETLLQQSVTSEKPPGPRRTEAPKKKLPNRQLGKSKPLTVLVVDDSPTNIAVCRRILELYGYEKVDSVMNGLQAVEAAEAKRYDLILLDLQMPVLDGFDALKRIQASPLAGAPICVSLSANADKATQKQCISVGFFATLNKPVDIPRLGELLSTVYDTRESVPAQSLSDSTSTLPLPTAVKPEAAPLHTGNPGQH